MLMNYISVKDIELNSVDLSDYKGKTLIWPAEWTHAHKGEVLQSGLKYIVTGWMHYPFNFK